MKRDENSENQDNVSQEILGMALDNKYSAKPQIPEASVLQKEMEKTKKEMEKLKGTLVKKYPFIQSISILPPQTIKRFIDEEEAPPETEKYIHLYIIVPEEKFKEIQKIKKGIVEEIEKTKQKTWLHLKTPVDVWEICLDSKFDLTS